MQRYWNVEAGPSIPSQRQSPSHVCTQPFSQIRRETCGEGSNVLCPVSSKHMVQVLQDWYKMVSTYHEAGSGPDVASVMGRKLPTINAGLATVSKFAMCNTRCHSHVPRVALDSERKAAPYLRIFRVWVWVFQGAARQNCFLGVVKRNGTKLLPI